MDRFIDSISAEILAGDSSLKSNMDRFIESIVCFSFEPFSGLKSNMDRFIGIKNS